MGVGGYGFSLKPFGMLTAQVSEDAVCFGTLRKDGGIIDYENTIIYVQGKYYDEENRWLDFAANEGICTFFADALTNRDTCLG